MSQEGFEPSTLALKGRYSTTELLARLSQRGKTVIENKLPDNSKQQNLPNIDKINSICGKLYCEKPGNYFSAMHTRWQSSLKTDLIRFSDLKAEFTTLFPHSGHGINDSLRHLWARSQTLKSGSRIAGRQITFLNPAFSICVHNELLSRLRIC